MERVNLLLDKYRCKDHREARELIDNPVVSNLLDEVISLEKQNKKLQSIMDDLIDTYTNDPKPNAVLAVLDSLANDDS
jgi:hypothetical protein